MRIYLRDVSIEDGPLIVKWRNAPNVSNHCFNKKPITIESNKIFYETHVMNGRYKQYIVERIDEAFGVSSYPIATVYLKDIDKTNRRCELCIFTSDDQEWNTESQSIAIKMLLQKAFEELNMHKVYSYVFVEFNDEIELLKSAGFRVEAVLCSEALNIEGSYSDAIRLCVFLFLDRERMAGGIMNLMGKRLLILGGQEVHCKVVEAAKELGIHTIVTDYLVGSPAKRIADESIMLSIIDVDAIVKWCTEHPVDGVINYCNDLAQKPYQEICQQLGLPCYGTKEQFDILTDKVKFKSICRQYGVDVIEEYTVEDVEQGLMKYPVLVKPSDSRGSRGQTICYSKEEVIDAIAYAKNESRSKTAIIEQFMAGHQDFVVAYYFVDGKPYLIRVDDRYTGSISENLNRQCIGSIAPSKFTSTYMKNVNDRVINMLENLKIKNGPVYMQGFVDGNTVRFYDPGFRFPGGEYELLLKRATGVDLVRTIVEYSVTGNNSLSGKLDDIYELRGKRVIQIPIVAIPGKIHKFEGVDKVSQMPNVIVASQYYKEGEQIPNSGDVKQRVARVSLIVDENDSVKETINRILSSIVIENEEGESLLATMISQSDLISY